MFTAYELILLKIDESTGRAFVSVHFCPFLPTSIRVESETSHCVTYTKTRMVVGTATNCRNCRNDKLLKWTLGSNMTPPPPHYMNSVIYIYSMITIQLSHICIRLFICKGSSTLSHLHLCNLYCFIMVYM